VTNSKTFSGLFISKKKKKERSFFLEERVKEKMEKSICPDKPSWNIEDGIISLADKNFTDVISILEEEGFERKRNIGTGSYTIVIIPDEHSDPAFIQTGEFSDKFKISKDFGYELEKYETYDSMAVAIGCILCGGLYTTMVAFEGEKNLTKEEQNEYVYFLPRGDVPIGERFKLISEQRRKVFGPEWWEE
jgi:hypothetical protein